ncbi:adenylosuccinate synthase [Pseudomonas sp. PDM19]|uniref:adenylosuccinate synthase n=1 Tax=Pseudomonas sp. PDM19 TaxID=2769272 RepID=UPI00177D5C09|nr:adenylosuccinate synthase [Pseudomonas sp. PDM19]MBD9630094.1 adenylosuccinate synthase [Pseudomonas sp. PDM19]
MDMTHAELCEIARMWLTRRNALCNHGCHLGLLGREWMKGAHVPDVLGFKAVGKRVESVAIQVRLAWSDADEAARKQPPAKTLGMGLYRYYLCPEGAIQPYQLPPRWGMLWVTRKGQVVPMAGAVAESWNRLTFHSVAQDWQHERDIEQESWLLVRAMTRQPFSLP